MLDVLHQVLKDINTGIDGVSYNNIKIGTNAAIIAVLIYGLIAVCRIDAKALVHFPWAEYGGALALILGLGGAGEAVKQRFKTEPPGVPPTTKTDDNKEAQTNA